MPFRQPEREMNQHSRVILPGFQTSLDVTQTLNWGDQLTFAGSKRNGGAGIGHERVDGCQRGNAGSMLRHYHLWRAAGEVVG